MNDRKVDLFYKTYNVDEQWLNYSLRSVYKFSEGFRQIVIVSNRGHHYTPPQGNLPIQYIELDVPAETGNYPNGVDYWWQMAIKMSWDQFTDADEAVIMDSDQVFYDRFSPASWRKDGRIMWLRRPWAEMGDAVGWKQGVDYFLGKDTANSHMVAPGFYMTRQAMQLYKEFMARRFGQTPFDYFIDLNHPGTSEFESYGAYMEEIQHYEYVFCHPGEVDWRPWPLRQFWSWGGLTEEVKQEIEGYLARE